MNYVVIKYVGNTSLIENKELEEYEFSNDIEYLRSKYDLPTQKIGVFDYNIETEGFILYKKGLNFGYFLIDTNKIEKDNIFANVVRKYLRSVSRDYKIKSIL